MSVLLSCKRKAANNSHPLLKKMDQTIIIIRKEPHGVIAIRVTVRPHTMGGVLEILQGKEIGDAGPIVGIILEGVVELEGMGSGGAGAEAVIAAISHCKQPSQMKRGRMRYLVVPL